MLTVNLFPHSAPRREKMVRFSIGEKETHDVQVQVPGFLLHKIEVHVDERLTSLG